MCRSSLSLQYCMGAVSCIMKNKRLYTALYLLGLFVFPLIVQPWHIIQHHGHDFDCSGHIHAIEQSYVHSQLHDQDCCHDSMLPLVSISNQDHSHDPCYICDYKFLVKDLPTPIEPGFVLYKFQGLHPANLIFSDLQRVYSQINSRAPPCSSPELS